MAHHDIQSQHSHEVLDTLRCTAILMAKGIYEQSQSFSLGRLVFQLVSGKMSTEDLVVPERFVEVEPMRDDEVKALQKVQMDWPVEITSMENDPGQKSLGSLVKKLGRTSLESSGDETASNGG